MKLDIVIFGLSITSSWGNGHATTYRALTKALNRRGHKVTFLERDVPWYRNHRDLPSPPYCRTELYDSLRDAPAKYARILSQADLVIVGSYVPDGIAICDWVTMNARGVTAFYDIDTPVTLSSLKRGAAEYLSPQLIPRFDLYLSFTGGPALETIEKRYGSPRARALYCSVDPEQHYPVAAQQSWEMGYLGTYSDDRQKTLERLLIEPARRSTESRFVVAGAQYPDTIAWPSNVELISHLPPKSHSRFYCSQRFTLNVTRAAMVEAGYSPSVRLFEAAACGVPIISDRWAGLDSFFAPGKEILVCTSSKQVLGVLDDLSEDERLSIAAAARSRVLSHHTAEIRASELERFYLEVAGRNVVDVTARRAAGSKVEANA